jgi:hypothetical protein
MQAKQTGAHRAVCIRQLSLIPQLRALQSSWRESHADPAYSGSPRPSAADACAHVWDGYGSES